MKRPVLNLLIDLLAAAFFIGMIATGYILYFPLPPGTNQSLVLWGLSRHTWGNVHAWISLGLLATLLVHLALHWQWIAVMLAKQFGRVVNAKQGHLRSGMLTFLGFVCLLAGFAWVTEVSVRAREEACCSDPDVAAVAVPSQVQFWQDVYPILETSCLRCHGPAKALGDFRIDRRDDYFGGEVPFVVPGNSAASPLIAIVSGERPDMEMADRHRLPVHEIAVLRAWIEAGAEWPEPTDSE